MPDGDADAIAAAFGAANCVSASAASAAGATAPPRAGTIRRRRGCAHVRDGGQSGNIGIHGVASGA